MYHNLPGLFLVMFEGYWEDEPENWIQLHINPNHVILVETFKRDEKEVATHYALHITETEYPFIVMNDQLEVIPREESNEQYN